MCSVVGYIGQRQSCALVMEGLARLEYRGYDSSGFACVDNETRRLMSAKSAGRLSQLVTRLQEKPIDGTVGVGHTRWSTHGVASEANAHPHFDCTKKISLVHNGIIENYLTLKKELEAEGHVFLSQTDSEVIAHLFERAFEQTKSCKKAVMQLVSQLHGAYAVVIVMEEHPELLIGIRKSSPLCIGVGDGEMFIASDVLAFAGKTDRVSFLPEKTFTLVTKDKAAVYDFDGQLLDLPVEKLDSVWTATEKQGHEHYMLKEIYEQKSAIYKTVSLCQSFGESVWNSIGISADLIKNTKRIKIIGCGTSWHAGRIAEFFFEEITRIPTTAVLASEFRYRTFFPELDTLYIAISQSGETADTLEVVRMLNAHGQKVLALTNVASSTLVRESEGFLLTQAGPELAVASTKAFTTQVAALYWLAARMALERTVISDGQFKQCQEELLMTANILENGLDAYKYQIFEKLALFYSNFSAFIFLGRHSTYPFALEAALKLKEIAYVFAQAYPAGELKHGPIALIDEKTPVCLFSHPDPLIYQKLLSNAQEIKARKGHLIVFAFEGQTELQALADTCLMFPAVNSHLAVLSMTGVMQLFMYAIARARGCDIDRPRNLAKSVTVE